MVVRHTKRESDHGTSNSFSYSYRWLRYQLTLIDGGYATVGCVVIAQILGLFSRYTNEKGFQQRCQNPSHPVRSLNPGARIEICSGHPGLLDRST